MRNSKIILTSTKKEISIIDTDGKYEEIINELKDYKQKFKTDLHMLENMKNYDRVFKSQIEKKKEEEQKMKNYSISFPTTTALRTKLNIKTKNDEVKKKFVHAIKDVIFLMKKLKLDSQEVLLLLKNRFSKIKFLIMSLMRNHCQRNC